jgi:hypothetical protein
MANRLANYKRNISPVNAWPWRGWQVCRGSRGLREG